MIHIVEQTIEEKIAMYMKLTKEEIIEMLIECNRILNKISKDSLERIKYIAYLEGSIE